jgi:hypothetical protein
VKGEGDFEEEVVPNCVDLEQAVVRLGRGGNNLRIRLQPRFSHHGNENKYGGDGCRKTPGIDEKVGGGVV